MKHTGPREYQVGRPGQELWADGVRREDGFLLETKSILDPQASPYVSNSRAPDFIRRSVRADADKEFRRYAAAIRDPATPFVGLEVIVNDERAVGYFVGLLEEYGIPGRVVVRP